jgi:MFS transporter, DHA2 family, multidrug resistance protein
MMRNLGGAVGIAMLQTFLTKREQFHSNVLTQSVSLFEEATRARIETLTQYFLSHGVADRAAAWHEAVVAIGRTVRQQAYIMAFGDTSYLFGAGLLVALVATLLLKRETHIDPGGAH